MCSLWPDASCPPCQRTCPVGKWLQIDTIFSISQLLALFCVSLLLLREDMNFLFHRESAVTGLYSFSRFHCYHSTKKDRVYQSCLNCIWNYFLSSSSSTASYTSTLPPVPLGLFSSVWKLNFNSAVLPLHSEQASFGFKTSKEQLWAISHLCVKAIEFILQLVLVKLTSMHAERGNISDNEGTDLNNRARTQRIYLALVKYPCHYFASSRQTM